jgi:hypothetical protein
MLLALVGSALIARGVSVMFVDVTDAFQWSTPGRVAHEVANREGGSLTVAGSICYLAAAILVRPGKGHD